VIIFISDLHLSDGTFDYHDSQDRRNDINHDISEEAFSLFWDSVHRIVTARRESRIREVTVVLLGDILELRSSTRWVASDYDREGRRVRLGDRPWRETRDAPSATCLKIFDNILRHNQGRLRFLTAKMLSQVPRSNGLRKLAERRIRIRFEYVVGNHDSLLIHHQDPVLRNRLARELGWRIVPGRSDEFPEGTKYVNSHLLITAEHGHRSDANDYFNNFYDAPLGCVTIDALGRFVYHLQKLSAAAPASLPRRHVRELVRIGTGFDNVRPSSDAYRWLMSRIPEDPETRKIFRRVLMRTVQELLVDLDPILDFVFSRTLKFLRRSRLTRSLARRVLRRLAARLARDEADLPLRRITDGISSFLNRMSWIGGLLSGKKIDPFHANALAEVLHSPAKYVLYGHTHRYETVPLLKVGHKRAFYFNTGTWNKTLARNLFDVPPRFDFQNWSRMTYIIFFDAARRENKKHVFELWHGDQKFVDE
jgi:UDP-2,3-diacylglucosamine pyrophosphatase LpxH